MTLHDEIVGFGERALEASRELTLLNSRKKNSILMAMADCLDDRINEIKEANAKDLESARESGLPSAILDRLTLTDARLKNMIKGIRAIAALKDPIGAKISRWIRPSGLEIIKRRVPIGVIAIIYESRPNVTADTAALCFKTANAVILRGGKEALNSTRAIADALITGGKSKGMPRNSIQLIHTTDRNAVKELVHLEGLVDLVIPRGGEALIKIVTEQARIPVIKHYKGVCHTYIDESADFDKAMNIVENAKCQRPGVCNAMETLLVHEKIAEDFLPPIAKRLMELNVELRGDATAKKIIPEMHEAKQADWGEEYLDLILAVKVVPSVKEAVKHINTHGSHHSDAIIAENKKAQDAFLKEVDSSTVYLNASTRFTDGGEFGMGAEIGISTDKLHARGPMGLEELTTYKYVVLGKGQVRE